MEAEHLVTLAHEMTDNINVLDPAILIEDKKGVTHQFKLSKTGNLTMAWVLELTEIDYKKVESRIHHFRSCQQAINFLKKLSKNKVAIQDGRQKLFEITGVQK